MGCRIRGPSHTSRNRGISDSYARSGKSETAIRGCAGLLWHSPSLQMHSVQFNNLTFHVGTSALENWSLLSKAKNRDWWWIHLASHASAHVLVETDVEPVAEELEFARQCILTQTPKAPRSARCVYAQRCWIKRGSAVGEVVIKAGKGRYFPHKKEGVKGEP